MSVMQKGDATARPSPLSLHSGFFQTKFDLNAHVPRHNCFAHASCHCNMSCSPRASGPLCPILGWRAGRSVLGSKKALVVVRRRRRRRVSITITSAIKAAAFGQHECISGKEEGERNSGPAAAAAAFEFVTPSVKMSGY